MFDMSFTRIKAPKFRVGRNVLNEYELRVLMAEVAEGKRGSGIKVREGNEVAEILPSGRLSVSLSGLKLCTDATLRVLRVVRDEGIKAEKQK